MTDTREQATDSVPPTHSYVTSEEMAAPAFSGREQAAGAGEWRVDEPLHGGWFVLKGHDGAVGFEVATPQSATIATRHLNVQEGTITELRAQLRHAWANLGCRCIFNADDTVELEESKCPWHGWHVTGDAPLVVPTLEAELATMRERAALAATELRYVIDPNGEWAKKHLPGGAKDALQRALDALTLGCEG